MKKRKNPHERTFKQCKAEASKYKTRQEFKFNASGSYYRAYRAGWLNRIFPKRKITLKECKADALKYLNHSAWINKSTAICKFAKKKDWTKLCTKHFIRYGGRKAIWTKSMCVAEAKKHKTIAQWIRNNEYSYKVSRRKGWFKACVKHFKRKQRFIWTKELCITEAKKHKLIKQWVYNSQTSYQASRRRGWSKACTKHMKRLRK